LEYANRWFPTHLYDFFAFIYRDSGYIGPEQQYHISNHAELIVKKCWDYDPVNLIMKWNEKETRFEF
jgi:hypothetical protein